MVVYGAEVCGQLFDGAIWFYGVTEIGIRWGCISMRG